MVAEVQGLEDKQTNKQTDVVYLEFGKDGVTCTPAEIVLEVPRLT